MPGMHPIGMWSESAAGAGDVTVSGEDVLEIGTSPRSAGIRVNIDGTIDSFRSGAYAQIDASTDWIIPNVGASSSYDVRVTSVVFVTGSWGTTPGTDGNWFDLGSNRLWEVSDNDSSSNGTVDVTFTLEIRFNGGSVLDSASYRLVADYFSFL